MWLENNGCLATVERAWSLASSGSPMVDVMLKVEACQQQIIKWSKDSVCNVSKTLKEKLHLLRSAEATTVKGRNVEFYLNLKSEISDLFRLEEKLWQQRSHDHWMVSGDYNSKYFHNRASQRFRRNSISILRDLEGVLVLGEDNVATMVVDYYTMLFTTSNPNNIEEVVQFIRWVVSDEMNSNLIVSFSKEEVEVALK